MNKSYLVVQRANSLLETQNNIGAHTIVQRITNGGNALKGNIIYGG